MSDFWTHFYGISGLILSAASLITLARLARLFKCTIHLPFAKFHFHRNGSAATITFTDISYSGVTVEAVVITAGDERVRINGNEIHVSDGTEFPKFLADRASFMITVSSPAINRIPVDVRPGLILVDAAGRELVCAER